MQEKTLYGQLLGNNAVGVALDGSALALHIGICLLDFRFVDRFIAYHPCDFVDYIVGRRRIGRHSNRDGGGDIYQMFEVHER